MKKEGSSLIALRCTPWSIYIIPIVRGAKVRRVPGTVVNQATGYGRLPLTPFMAAAVIEAFQDDAEIPDELRKLAASLQILGTVRASLTNLSEPASRLPWWPHQTAAFWFIRKLFDAGFRGVGLFSELGTGKSKVAVGLADALAANMILCVGPRSASLVWHREFRKHAVRDYQIILPDIDVSVEERLRRVQTRLRRTSLPKVIIINYDAIWRPPFGSWVLDQTWDLVIADELHRIKSPKSKVSLFMAELRDRARYRVGLTGTPLHHRPLDIWAQYRFLEPGVFGLDYWAFQRRYSSVQKGRRLYQHEEEFTRKLYSISFRATDVLQLPEVVHKHVYGELREAAQLYRAVERDIIAEVKSGAITIKNALVRLTRLQQITSGHVRDDGGNLQVVGREKEELFDDVLTDLPAEPIVVFCEFHYDLDRVAHVCKKHRLKCAELSGRKDELAAWLRGDADVLAVQMRTGSQSIDLTRARYAIYYSFGLSLGDYEQSLKRVHRAGQTRPVTYVHLIMDHTIDERKLKYLERQADIIQGLLVEYAQEG